MVLFDNIKLNQNVLILRDENILKGRVLYKGHVNGIPGEWVGVELEQQIGLHNGVYNGRRYFSCKDKHGIFTTASQIRFVPILKRSVNSYISLNFSSEIEDNLFKNDNLDKEIIRSINSDYKKKIFEHKTENDERKYFPLRHSVSNFIKPSSMSSLDQDSSVLMSYHRANSSLCSSPNYLHKRYSALSHEDVLKNEFEIKSSKMSEYYTTPPSIPKTSMPHSLQKLQSLRGWQGKDLPREISVNTARDNMYQGLCKYSVY